MMDRIRATFAKVWTDKATRLWRNEDGNASVEFMLAFPIYFSVLMMSLELSFITLRETMLERGLDMAVRDLRLGTGAGIGHEQIKTAICDNALIISDCQSNVMLEMIPTDIRNLGTLGNDVICRDVAAEADPLIDDPVDIINQGGQNQLMFLRACLTYDPIFPTTELAKSLDTSTGNGMVAITSKSAFVLEPL